jgi:dihydrodipicolinate synthase/N-acetylneuraminate lyase
MHVLPPAIESSLRRGVVIPAHPLALTENRKLDERRQRALSRYYLAAGAGGLAVGVHTTQFEIRKPEVGLFRPVLELAIEEIERADEKRSEPTIRVAGVIGRTTQAVAEANLVRDLGYHVALLGLAALKDADDDALVEHCRAVAEIIPVMGFYLQPAVGGRVLSERFWTKFAQIENVVAIKVAPFNRYHTLDVVRGVAASGRASEIVMYTGNDDSIVTDLITPYDVQTAEGDTVTVRFAGGLLGHWAVWTHGAVQLLDDMHELTEQSHGQIPESVLTLATQVTDMNAAVFDAKNDYAGVIAGVHEVLRRQGILEGTWCLNESETLSPGQAEELSRVSAAYPHLTDDAFVEAHLDEWLA